MPIRDRAENAFPNEPVSTLGAKLYSGVQKKLKAMLHRQPRFHLALHLLARLNRLARLNSRGLRRFAEYEQEGSGFVFSRPFDFLHSLSRPRQGVRFDQTRDDSWSLRASRETDLGKLANLVPRLSSPGAMSSKSRAHGMDPRDLARAENPPRPDSGVVFENKARRVMPQDRIQLRPLSPQTLQLFSQLLQVRLPAVYMHQSEKTDRFLQAHGAEAMTLGSHVYFRRDHADLNKPQSLGLLGHELTHVAQQEPTNAWRHAGARQNRESAEGAALANERFVLRQAPFLSGESHAPANWGASTTPSTSPAAHAATPMFAQTSRPVNESPTSNHMPALSEMEMRRIKDEVYRDLMMRIKTDFERGA